MKKTFIILSTAFMLLLAACTEEIKEPDRMAFSLSETEITDQGKGLSVDFTIHTTEATIWRIKPEADYPWVSVSATGGQGETLLTCTMEENLGPDERRAAYSVEAYLYGELYASQELHVIQSSQTPFISLDPEQLLPLQEISCFAHEFILDIVSNEEWEAKLEFDPEDPGQWLSVNPARGNGRTQVKINVLPNGTPAPRNAKLGFLSANCREELPLMQKQYEPAEITGLTLHMDRMSGFIPDGTGELTLVNLKNTHQEVHQVEVLNKDGMTDILFRDAIISGSYHIAGYRSGGQTYDISRATALTIADTDKEILVSGWNLDFNTYHGTSHEDPILLDTEGLAALAAKVNSGAGTSGLFFALTGPADLSGIQWTSIGKSPETPFEGSFDGRGHAVTGLRIVATEMYNAFFGVVTGRENALAVIENMNFQSSASSGPDIDASAGAAFTSVVCAAALDHVRIIGCQNHLDMKLSHMSAPVAGAVGTAVLMQYLTPEPVDVIIENCHNYGDIELCPAVGMNWNIGGIAGANKGIVRRCSNHGRIINPDTSMKAMQVGGLVGNNARIVEECYNTGEMKGKISQAGGIVGLGSGCETWIENCYSTGDLSTSEAPAGGIIGAIPGSNKNAFLHMLNCYSSGTMGGKKTGGVIGILGNGAKYIIRFCACKSPVNASGGNKFEADDMKLKWGERLRKLDPALWYMQSTFTSDQWATDSPYLPDWNFETVWGIDEGSSAPYLLRNEQLPHPTNK